MNTTKLWELYERSLWNQKEIEERIGAGEDTTLNLIEQYTQSGVSNGILKSIEVLEKNPQETWKKSFAIFCKLKGIDVNTGFGFWVPISERVPKKTTNCLISFNDGFVTVGTWLPEYEIFTNDEGDWGECRDADEVIAWMPLPEAFEPK